jgi:hypothetical protein
MNGWIHLENIGLGPFFFSLSYDCPHYREDVRVVHGEVVGPGWG